MTMVVLLKVLMAICQRRLQWVGDFDLWNTVSLFLLFDWFGLVHSWSVAIWAMWSGRWWSSVCDHHCRRFEHVLFSSVMERWLVWRVGDGGSFHHQWFEIGSHRWYLSLHLLVVLFHHILKLWWRMHETGRWLKDDK